MDPVLLDNMVKEFKRIDKFSIMGIQVSDASDGVINIRPLDFNDSPQAYQSFDIVRKAFGIQNAGVAYSILRYLDELDGKKRLSGANFRSRELCCIHKKQRKCQRQSNTTLDARRRKHSEGD
jgi:hypothetical protein